MNETLADLRMHLETSDRKNPYPAAVLALAVGVSTRELQDLVGELIDEGVLVGSTCGRPAGYFLIRDLEDLEEGTRHITARAKASLYRVSKVRRLAEEKFGPEAARLFDLEEVPA